MDFQEKKALIEKEDLDLESMLMLVRDENWKVRQALARRQDLPFEVFKFLIQDTNKDVKEALISLMNKEVDESKYYIRYYFKDLVKNSWDICINFIKFILENIYLKKPSLFEKFYKAYICYDDLKMVITNFLRTEDLSEDFLLSLIDNKYKIMQNAISRRKLLTNDLIIKLVKSYNVDIVLDLLKLDNLSRGILELIASVSSGSVKEALSWHKDLPSDLIEQLSKDPYENTRKIIASRRDLSFDIFERFVNDRSSVVRSQIAKSTNYLSLDLVKKYLCDVDLKVRASIIERIFRSESYQDEKNYITENIKKAFINEDSDDLMQQFYAVVSYRAGSFLKDLPQELSQQFFLENNLQLKNQLNAALTRDWSDLRSIYNKDLKISLYFLIFLVKLGDQGAKQILKNLIIEIMKNTKFKNDIYTELENEKIFELYKDENIKKEIGYDFSHLKFKNRIEIKYENCCFSDIQWHPTKLLLFLLYEKWEKNLYSQRVKNNTSSNLIEIFQFKTKNGGLEQKLISSITLDFDPTEIRIHENKPWILIFNIRKIIIWDYNTNEILYIKENLRDSHLSIKNAGFLLYKPTVWIFSETGDYAKWAEWNYETNELFVYNLEKNRFFCIVHPSGRLFAAFGTTGYGCYYDLYKIFSATEQFVFPPQGKKSSKKLPYMYSVVRDEDEGGFGAFSPDGKIIAFLAIPECPKKPKIGLYNVNSKDLLSEFEVFERPNIDVRLASFIKFTHRGEYIAYAVSEYLYIYDLSGKELKVEDFSKRAMSKINAHQFYDVFAIYYEGEELLEINYDDIREMDTEKINLEIRQKANEVFNNLINKNKK